MHLRSSATRWAERSARNLAAIATKNGLPRPRAVLCVQPGRKLKEMPGPARVELENLAEIPASTLLITLAGDADDRAGDADARLIFQRATSVAPVNRNFVLLRSDSRGTPALRATHSAPAAPDASYDNGEAPPSPRLRRRGRRSMPQPERAVNALDYYGTWKLFDALCDAAFSGKNREYALGNTPQQRYMGKWSDGVPVRELEVTVGR